MTETETETCGPYTFDVERQVWVRGTPVPFYLPERNPFKVLRNLWRKDPSPWWKVLR